MKYLIFIFIFYSCSSQVEHEKKVAHHRAFVVSSTNDNGWTRATVECDSFNFVNRQRIDVWVDGQKMAIEADIINTYSASTYFSD